MENKKCSIKNTFFILLGMVFVLGLVFCVGKKDIYAQEQAEAYISVEKFTIGQGFLVEPSVVDITEGETVADVLVRFMDEKEWELNAKNTKYGFYLEGIYNADSGNGHVPQCIQTMTGNKVNNNLLNPASEKNICYPDLEEFSYQTVESGTTTGWCYYINNTFPPIGMGSYKVSDGDVIRIRFTLTDGDLALTDNLDSMIKRMAVYNENKSVCDAKGYSAQYQNARNVISNMDSTKEQVQAAYEQLPTEQQMEQWAEEKAAADKAAADKAAADKAAEEASRQQAANAQKDLTQQYTPSKTKLKSAKKQSTRSVRLTWKKVKGCTGYEVYMSKKKNSGYKKIATLKKAKKVTYTKKKLKKKKTYYFKVRTYKTVNGKKYCSTFSNVKKVKMK